MEDGPTVRQRTNAGICFLAETTDAARNGSPPHEANCANSHAIRVARWKRDRRDRIISCGSYTKRADACCFSDYRLETQKRVVEKAGADVDKIYAAFSCEIEHR